jgi:hypothetical protein
MNMRQTEITQRKWEKIIVQSLLDRKEQLKCSQIFTIWNRSTNNLIY